MYILYLQHQQSISTVMRAHARIRIRCERVQCEHMRMRAFASHCMRTHFSCVMRAFAYVIWASSVCVMRVYARIRMRCERIRIACARIRIACARIACECAHLRGTYACPVLYEPQMLWLRYSWILHHDWITTPKDSLSDWRLNIVGLYTASRTDAICKYMCFCYLQVLSDLDWICRIYYWTFDNIYTCKSWPGTSSLMTVRRNFYLSNVFVILNVLACVYFFDNMCWLLWRCAFVCFLIGNFDFML